MQQPIQLILSQLETGTLIFPADYSIAETVNIALKWPADQIFEPILVAFGSQEYRLLDIYTLKLKKELEEI